jgi:hypothetical protein
MTKKPEKWGVKLWLLADSVLKFIYSFEIYFTKNLEPKVKIEGPCGKVGIVCGVVLEMLHGIEEKGHCIVINNHFFSIPLFQDLVQKGIYSTKMVRSHHIGFPSHFEEY